MKTNPIKQKRNDDVVTTAKQEETTQNKTENAEQDETKETEVYDQEEIRALLEKAVAAAQEATQVAQMRAAALSEMENEVRRLKRENAVLDAKLCGVSDKNKALLYQEAGADMSENITLKDEILQELAPYIDSMRKHTAAEEQEKLVAELSEIPELADIQTYSEKVKRVLENNEVLSKSDAAPEEKMITAYAIVKGIEAVKKPEPDADALMLYYENNPDFQKRIAEKNANALREGSQVVPFSAGGDAASCALTVTEKPKTWNEARNSTKKLFGI